MERRLRLWLMRRLLDLISLVAPAGESFVIEIHPRDDSGTMVALLREGKSPGVLGSQYDHDQRHSAGCRISA
jgi:hypothetical protein